MRYKVNTEVERGKEQWRDEDVMTGEERRLKKVKKGESEEGK